jgi:membrane peptidoglycan carboxypeptidase
VLVLSAFLVLFAGFLGLCSIVYSAVRIPLPQNVTLPQQNTLTYADGSTMDSIGSVNRVSVPLAQVPAGVRQAVLAAEDRDFYSEPGISVRGIGRALLADVTGGGIKQGGSTITQQYAKNAYLGQQRTFTRKIKEIVLAVKLSRKYSKDQILDFYLNTIYFGRGAYGIQAASHAYFGEDVSQLTSAQGAVLAGLIRAPSVLDPRVSPQAAKQRWTQVVDQMVKDKALTSAQRAALVYPTTIPAQTAAERAASRGPTTFIDQQVDAFLVDKFGQATVDLGGLTVTTTIDKKAQAAAVTAVQAESAGAPAGQRAALVAVNPRTGAVVAYYGGSDYTQADAAGYLTAPPGSSFKPITLAAALAGGASLSDRYSGVSPQQFGADSVHNFDNEQFGDIDLVSATAHSVNTVYVRLAQQTGPATIAALAHSLGVPDSVRLQPVPEIALGTEYVRALDMAGVYTAFANGGKAATPYFVSKVTDRNGKVIYRADPQPRQVLSASTASGVTTALRAVLTEGTASGSQLAGGRPAAGKTGTTGNNISAWFDGYTPDLVAVVSYTRPDASGKLQSLTPYRGSGFSEVTGSTVPAKTWKLFMDAALAGTPTQHFPADVGVTAPATTTPPAAPSTSAPATTTPPASVSPTPTPSTSPSEPVTPSAPVTLSAPASSPPAAPSESALARAPTGRSR